MPATYKDNGGSVNGSNLEFTYDFPTLKTEDVKVSLNGATQATTKYTVSLSPAKITFNNTNVDSTVQESTGAPKSGVAVRVYRQTTVGKSTGDEDPKAVFAAGSSIRATDLNANQEQALFGIQELQEQPIDEGSIGESKLDIHADPSGTNKVLGYTSNGMEWVAQASGATIDDTPVDGVTDEAISSNWAYDHNAGTGNGKHVPAAGSSGQFLKHDGTWGTPPDTNTTYSVGDNGLTKNNFTDALKTKLDGIAANAEVNVQSDWNSSSGDNQILNKPTIPSNIGDLSNVSNTSPSTNQVLKWDGSNWSPGADNTSSGSGTTNLSNTANGTSLTVESSSGDNTSLPAATTSAWGVMTDEDKTKLDGIATGAEVNVQSDWNASSGDAQILNKPTIPTNTDTTYSISCVDGDNSDEEKIRLTAGGSGSGTDDVVLEAGTGLSIARSGDKITFTNTVTDTNTQLTTEEVQDIIGGMVDGGTETNISVTYDDTNGKLNFVSTDTNTTYSVTSTSAAGLAPQLPGSHGGKFLKADGTWEVPPDTDSLSLDDNTTISYTSSGASVSNSIVLKVKDGSNATNGSSIQLNATDGAIELIGNETSGSHTYLDFKNDSNDDYHFRIAADSNGNLYLHTPSGGALYHHPTGGSAAQLSTSGGEVNQNAFSNVAVSGQTTVAADSKTDTLTLAAGSNVTITTTDGTDTVTIAATDTNTTDLASDSSPQLGANLDVQTSEITTSTTNGNIKLNPNGTGVVEVKGDGSSADGTLQLNCSQNSHGIKLKSPPHSAGASYTLTFPNTDGNANQVLKTDGSGGLDWVTVADSTKIPTAGGTFTGSVTFEDAINENVFAITDGNAAIDPDNGTIQTWTLGANRTPTDSLTAGQSVLLMITAGSNTITWPTMTWAGGSAPTLSTSSKTAIELWKVGSTLYGANVGDV